MSRTSFPSTAATSRRLPSRGGASVTININLPTAADADRIMAQAEKAGARITMPAADQFWGAHYGRLVDPFGDAWSFSAPVVKTF